MQVIVITIFVLLMIILIFGSVAYGKRKQAEEIVCMHSHWENGTCRNCGKIYEDDKE